MSTKSEMRSIVRSRLAAMTKDERKRKDKLCAERLLSSPEYAAARTLFLYLSTPREVDTHAVLKRALADGKRVFLPRVEGEDMLLVPYFAGDPLQVGAFGISEPFGEGADDAPDLAVLPLLAFDRSLARLGKGKGYYDRFIASYPGKSLALAYAEQEVDAVPVEAFDRRVDAVLTDRERVE